MLRPTDRLRRLCQDRNYYISRERDYKWSELTELEFIRDESACRSWNDSVNPTFPSDFRWEAFSKCWSRVVAICIMLYPASSKGDPGLLPVKVLPSTQSRRFPGTRVLWLSDTIFLSVIEFVWSCSVPLPTHLYQYKVSFSHGRDAYYVYSIASFKATTQREAMAAAWPSKIPINFFQHVTACLPAGFFNHLELSDCRELFSPKLCTLFLSIVKPHENTVENGTTNNSSISHQDGYRMRHCRDSGIPVGSHHGTSLWYSC
jgi:hypothetical protein